MILTINTKFDVGDEIYVAYHHYDFYASEKPYIVKDVCVQSNFRRTHIVYEIEEDGVTWTIPEAWAFATYADCAKWCKEHN